MLNPTRDAINADKELSITYQDVGNELRQALDAYHGEIPTINIRHMPFCMLKGHEKHVKTMWQLQYERVEWDWCMDIIHKRGSLFMYGAAAFGMARMWRHPRLYNNGGGSRLHDALQYARIFNDRRQAPECSKCDLRNICDGLPKQYYADRKSGEVAPYTLGQTISDPTHFMPDDEKEDSPKSTDFDNVPGTPSLLFGQYRKRQPPMPRAKRKDPAAQGLPQQVVLVEPPTKPAR